MYSKEENIRFLKERVARPSSAGIIIENDKSEALILKANYKKYWSFPGGWIEDDQTPSEAAIRELKEEAGIDVSIDSLKLIQVVNRKSSFLSSYQFIFKTSEILKDTSIIRLQPEEIDDYRFVTKKEILDNLEMYSWAVQNWAKNENKIYTEETISL